MIRLLGDCILVRPEDTTSEVLILPNADSLRADRPGDWQDSFTGVVVAVGPGDKVAVGKCGACGAEKRLHVDWNAKGFARCKCGAMDFVLDRIDRLPMECKVGDHIVFPRRPTQRGGESHVMVDGERYLLFAEEQFAYAIIESEAAA